MKLRQLALSLAVAAALAPAAQSQAAPKPGREYVDSVDLGFKIKMPDGWEFLPAQPNEPNEIGKYSAGRAGLLIDPKAGRAIINLDVLLLKFDRRATLDAESEGTGHDPVKIVASVGSKDFAGWLDKLRGGWKQKEKKDLTVGKVGAVRYVYEATLEGMPVRFLAYDYALAPDVNVAAVFFGPGEDKKWNKFESAGDSMAKSFRPVEVVNKIAAARSSSLRDVKRHDLELEVAKNPGWALYETPNYFVISAKNDDKQFIQELLERLEAIREVYEATYPPPLAAELRALAKAREAAEAEKEKKDKPEGEPVPEGEPEDAPAPESDEFRTRAERADPMELSKCSVVRICKDRDHYHSYGGPGGSAGYWSSWHKELVLYDDQAGGGRRNTWAVLNHEAFHQYIYYFFGELAPHSWYNEGTGDFFSGYQLEHKKFQLKTFDWRQRLIQTNIRAGKFAPLKDLVRWTQSQYYGNNDLELDGGDNYAQGWSFIYFLRTGKKSAKGWNPAWDSILDVYLRALVETDDLDQAVDRAFAGVDWEELEKCWKEYTLQS
jgi:hypothetical protein